MKAYLLARVSTDEQNDALPAQTGRLIAYANLKGYEYELIEFTESAYSNSRDLFRAFIDKVQTLTDHAIIVFDKIDRYSRDSSSEEVRILRNLYRSGKIELHFPSDNLIINKNSPATDKMRLGLGTILAEYYSDAIRDNVLRRIEQKLKAGEWIGRAPFGYAHVTQLDGTRTIVLDGINAEAMRYAFREYATGLTSLQVIRKDLIEKFGITVGKSVIADRLNNPFYYGMMCSNGVLYAHKYEKLISQELFEQVQDVKNGTKAHNKRWAGLPFQYRGLISCSDCGHRITFEKHKGKYVYGHCSQYSGKHNAKYINENIITEQISDLIEAIHIPDDAYEEVSRELKASYARDNASRLSQVDDIKNEITKLENRLNRLHDEFFDGNISRDIFNAKTSEYRSTIQKLKNNLKTFELGEDSRFGEVSHLLRLANQAPELFKIADQKQKRSMIETVLSNLQLDGDQLRSEYKKPFETMAFCNEISSWCPE